MTSRPTRRTEHALSSGHKEKNRGPAKHNEKNNGVPVKLLLEFLMTAGLALLFHVGLHMEREAYVVFAVGLLLTSVVYLLETRIAELKASILDAIGHLQPLHSLVDLIGDVEAATKGRTLLESTHNILALLRQGDIPLTESEYYYETTQSLGRCAHLVQAVNAVDIADWIGKMQKRNYYRAQVEALQRGIKVWRIFVLHRTELESLDIERTIRSQLDDGIKVCVALREDLRFSGQEGVETDANFVLLDHRELFIRKSVLGLYYGKKTRLPSEIARFERTYRILRQHARPAEEVLDVTASGRENTENEAAPLCGR